MNNDTFILHIQVLFKDYPQQQRKLMLFATYVYGYYNCYIACTVEIINMDICFFNFNHSSQMIINMCVFYYGFDCIVKYIIQYNLY